MDITSTTITTITATNNNIHFRTSATPPHAALHLEVDMTRQQAVLSGDSFYVGSRGRNYINWFKIGFEVGTGGRLVTRDDYRFEDNAFSRVKRLRNHQDVELLVKPVNFPDSDYDDEERTGH